MSVPVLKYAKVDGHLRMMVLASLLKMSRDMNETVPAPQGLLFHPLTALQHDKYRQTLGGITDDNVREVSAQLRKLVPQQTRVGQTVGAKPQVILSDDESSATTQRAVMHLQGQVAKVLELLGKRQAGEDSAQLLGYVAVDV